MEREHLKAYIADRLGLAVRDIPGCRDRVEVVSLTGAVLFDISIFGDEESGWAFGGAGALLQQHWEYLCRLRGDQ